MKAMTQYKFAGNTRAAEKFVLRLPEGMRDRVAEVAKKSHRSMNSEIVARLDESLNSAKMDEPHLTSDQLSLHELKLINYFRQMNLRQRTGLLEFVSVVSEAPASQAANQQLEVSPA